MWRVILIDDEEYVRVELAALFPWDRYQFSLIAEASDAQTAFKLIEELNPDLVITDIRMPERDGLELIAWIRQHYPKILTAVISAYNDFPYVREALRLGAVDYLIKAEATLETADLFLSRIRGILEDRTSTRHKQEELTDNVAQYLDLATESFWRDTLTGALNAAEITQRAQQLNIPMEKTWFGIILIHLNTSINQQKHQALHETLTNNIQKHLGTDWIWNLVNLKPEHFVIIAGRNEESPDPEAVEELQRIAHQITLDITVKKTVSTSTKLSLLANLPQNFRILKKIHRLKATNCPQGPLPFRKALSYIHANFTKDLSLAEIATHTGVSKSHLCRIFAKYAGEHFNTYLQRLRIERAKELLCFSDEHIYEIAVKVGFWDSRYFSKIFRDFTGLSPSEYRRVSPLHEESLNLGGER